MPSGLNTSRSRFEHGGNHRRAEIGIFEARRARIAGVAPRRRIGELGLKALPQRHDIARIVAQPGAVRQQVPERHRRQRVVGRTQLPPKIVRNVAVKIDLAFIHQPQRGEGHDQLGDRSDPHRIIGLERAAGVLVRQPFDDQRANGLTIKRDHHGGRRRGGVLGGKRRGGRTQQQGGGGQAADHGAHHCRLRARNQSRFGLSQRSAVAISTPRRCA